jgi:hypothetical protein
MKVNKNLIYQKIKNSFRKLFFKKLVISNLVFYLSIIYIIFLVFKTSYFIKASLLNNDINIKMFSVYFIILVAVLDLIVKLIFSKIKIFNVYPYLRLKIQRKRLANFVIIMNHFNLLNIIGFLLLVPITVLSMDCVELIDLVLILLSLSIIFVFNNYISMIINIMSSKMYLFVITPILFSLLYFIKNSLLVNMLHISLEIRQIVTVFFILLTLLLSILSHGFIKKKIIKMLYIK